MDLHIYMYIYVCMCIYIGIVPSLYGIFEPALMQHSTDLADSFNITIPPEQYQIE